MVLTEMKLDRVYLYRREPVFHLRQVGKLEPIHIWKLFLHQDTACCDDHVIVTLCEVVAI
jgi:hypothetical protein